MFVTHYFLSFIEGVGLILSPCILPILPIVLATSIDGGQKRPLGIIAGFIFSFSLFALLSHQIIQALDINPEIIRYVSLSLLIFIGISMVIPSWSNKLAKMGEGLSNFANKKTNDLEQKTKPGFKSGFLIGTLIGLIWTPCAGPLMAAALIQIAQSGTTMDAAITTLLFVTGAGVPMFLIAMLGKDMVKHMNIFKKHAQKIRTFFGVLIITMAVLIWTGADVKLLAQMPQNPLNSNVKQYTTLQHALPNPYKAPDIVGIQDWINSTPLNMEKLKGKVVLIDFWTYSCINCIRTMPYVKAWHDRYKDDGLVIIGVHTPEFAFEKDVDNVQGAVNKFNVPYPVAIDNNWTTWRNYSNRYWPAHYLINREGQVVYTHFGEGNYDITEGNIRVLLGLNAPADPVKLDTGRSAKGQTPETYLGYRRLDQFANAKNLTKDQTQQYTLPDTLPLHTWGLDGSWDVTREYITNRDMNTSFKIHFKGKKVFIVLGHISNGVTVADVLLNGKPIGDMAGADVQQNIVTIGAERLYEIVNQDQVTEGILEIRPRSLGMKAYALTFGQ